MANILYRKQKQQKSLDNGVTWIDTGEYRVGAVLENPSNCASADSRQCRWVDLLESEGYYCDGYSKYTVQVEECTENGLIWTRTGNSKRGNTLIESESIDCGFVYETNYGYIKYLTTNQNSRIYFNGILNSTYKPTITDYSEGVYLATVNVDKALHETHYYIFDKCNWLFVNGEEHINNPMWLCEPIAIIELPDTSDVTEMIAMFADCSGLTTLDLSGLNVSNVTDMQHMFSQCDNLTSLDLSGWDTSNVTNMSAMFSGCKSLTSLDLRHFNTSNVSPNNDGSHSFDYMFMDCSSLTSLDLSNFNTSKAGRMSAMFNRCSSLTSLDLSSFDTSNVTNMGNMFAGCSGLTTLDLSNFNTSNVTDMYGIFFNCSNLISLNLSGWDMSNAEINDMFNGCSVENLNLSNSVLSYLGFIPTTIKSINFSNVDTSKATVMEYIFAGCSGLTTLDLSSFDTSNVNSMEGMFRNCTSLETINVTGWDITNVIDDTYIHMFENCNSLVNLILGEVTEEVYSWWCNKLISSNLTCDVINATIIDEKNDYISFTFSGTCEFSLNRNRISEEFDIITATTSPYIMDLNDLGISELHSTFYMFHPQEYGSNYSLLTVDKMFDMSNVTDNGGMFRDCKNLTYINLSNCNFTFNESSLYVFRDCTSLKTIDLTGAIYDKYYQSIGNIENPFLNCYALERVILGDVTQEQYNWIYDRLDYMGLHEQVTIEYTIIGGDTSGETSGDTSGDTSYELVFVHDNQYGCNYTLNGISYSTKNYGKEEDNGDGTYIYSTTLEELGITELTSTSGFASNCKYILISVDNFLNTSNVTNMSRMFEDCWYLKSLNTSNWNTSNVTNMSYMFAECSGLTSLDLSGWDTSNVTNMTWMFERCENLTSINGINNFNTTNLGNASYLFYLCRNLTSLDLSSWNTSNVTNMSNMFSGCYNLTSLDLSGWDTSNVTDMSDMFNGCDNLVSLNLSGWNTSNVTNINYIFSECVNLQTLDLSGWDISNIKNYSNMLSYCWYLRTIYCYGCNETTINTLERLKPSSSCTLVY